MKEIDFDLYIMLKNSTIIICHTKGYAEEFYEMLQPILESKCFKAAHKNGGMDKNEFVRQLHNVEFKKNNRDREYISWRLVIFLEDGRLTIPNTYIEKISSKNRDDLLEYINAKWVYEIPVS